MSCIRRGQKNCCYISDTHTQTYKHTQIHEYVPDFEKKKRIAYNYTIRITAMRGS